MKKLVLLATGLLLVSVTFVKAQTASPMMASNEKISPTANTAPVATRSLSADKKTYVTASGITLTVGQKIMLGNPSEKQLDLFNHIHLAILHQIDTSTKLPGENANLTIEIKDFRIINDVPYLYFKKGFLMYAVTIENAINDNELKVQ